MRTIWKFPLPWPLKEDVFDLTMPLGALPLHFERGSAVGGYDVLPTVWAEVDDEQPIVGKAFLLVGTGHPIPVPEMDRRYVGTCFDGPFVWHLFEIVR